MDKKYEETLLEIDQVLDALLKGQVPKKMSEDAETDPPLAHIIEKLNQLIKNIGELNTMSGELANGQLDGLIPPRHNMMAGNLKSLQSSLNTLAWSAEELAKGKVVSKLFGGPGDTLFISFNRLIDSVAEASSGSASDSFAVTDEEEAKVNSWRYHQILTAVNMLDIYVIETDGTGKIVYQNTPAKEMLQGLTHLSEENLPEDANALMHHFADYSHKDKELHVEKELYDENEERWYRVSTDILTLPSGQSFFLHVADDITDWKTTEERLEFSANFDPLTSTMNRRAGLKMLNMLNDRPSEKLNSIAFIDVDGLKSVNDTHGHTEGDEYLKIVANTLVSFSRSTESVVRYGGDEFFILFQECPAAVADKIMGRMRDELEYLNESGAKPYHMSFSYGVEEFGSTLDLTAEEVLEAADQKMYRDKERRGKQRTV